MVFTNITTNTKKQNFGTLFHLKIVLKFSFVIFISFLIYPVSVSSALTDANLVANPSFEIGATVPMNWTLISQNGIIPKWDNVSHGGSKSAKISISGSRNKVSGYPRSDLISVSPLTKYTVSAWGKTQNAGGTNTPAARVVELDANKNWILQTNLPVFSRGTNDWTEKIIEFQTSSNTKYLYLYANIWKGYGTFWLDDVELRLKNISTPAPSLTPTPTQTPTATPKSEVYNLVWSDDFNNTLDQTKWEIITTAKYPWQECNTKDNAFTDGSGNLVLRIKSGVCPNTNPSVSGFDYTTGMVKSLTAFQYGYFEARAKMSTNHVNNAFWLVGKDWSWPPEIDVYESEGYRMQPTKIWNAYHYGSSSSPQETGKEISPGPDYSQGYHIFGMEWTPTYVRWLIDGTETFRTTLTPTTQMQIVLSINKGWNYDVQGDNLPTTYPLYHNIDYIRVYQKK